ncbi:Thiol-disulfide oxidoreductase ResA [Paenibacillus plantiphilus]|uniref:Thiol-disulfide oxidoreductase ResA n=1 Tax=Paenibacillus plantiphilus TaxID=2905650 RepID=A0ABM9BU68_9BACL|nr:thiol-disulfide oxidoreductase ResA [Paenibacillus plantiphilus]CAH1193739.1 Thiol-disulfide oxidoreductase ResA [Paenibacillus plantiphilus]
MAAGQARKALQSVILLIAVIAAAYAIMKPLLEKEGDLIKVGEAVPDFTLVNMEGEAVELKDYRGKGVIINFWGTWCGPCEKEMPRMNEAYRSKPDDVEILAVNLPESPVSVSAFVEKYGIDFPVLMDADGDVVAAYKVGPIPVTFLVDENGILQERILGELSTVEYIQELMSSINPVKDGLRNSAAETAENISFR